MQLLGTPLPVRIGVWLQEALAKPWARKKKSERPRLAFVAGGNQVALLPDGFVSSVGHSDIRRIFRYHNLIPSRAAGIEEQLGDPADLVGLDIVNQFADRESLNHRGR